MRRIVIFTACLLCMSIGLMPQPQPVYGQFATNTPSSNDNTGGGNVPIQATPTHTATDATANNGFAFATNTPAGPTATPSATSTSTNTPTATLTPTNTPSPTNTATYTNTPTATFTPTSTPSPTPTPNGPFSYPEGVNPLTGLPYPDAEAMNRRTLIVKISNFPPVVRPQYGINQADIVYEYEAEGGVTRFAALYRSQTPERVGSIRSARLMDMELVTMYQALLAYSGTSEPIQQMLLNADFAFQLLSPSIGDNCTEAGFCRFPREGVAFEHTLFGDTSKMWQRATARNVNTGYVARGFAFSEERDSGGVPIADIFIDWYGQTDARWQYDETSERYVRYTDDVPHYDAATGEQLWADNVVVIMANHQRRPDLFPPGADYESLEVQLWDDPDFWQQAYLLRDGQLYQGFWTRRNRNPGTALQLIYGDNTPMMMKPGRTWVAIVRGFGDVQTFEVKNPMPDIPFDATPTSAPTLEGVG